MNWRRSLHNFVTKHMNKLWIEIILEFLTACSTWPPAILLEAFTPWWQICELLDSIISLLQFTGLDRSDRSFQRQFPEDPLSELSWNFRWTSKVPIIHQKFRPVLLLICIILRLFWLEVILGWYDNFLWPIWSIVNVMWDYNFTQRMC